MRLARRALLSLTFYPAVIIHTWAGPLQQQVFAHPDLYLSSRTIPYSEIASRLPNQAGWSSFFTKYGPQAHVRIDPRSGTLASLLGHFPLVPGRGRDNTVTLESLSRDLGHQVEEVTGDVISTRVRQFILENEPAIGITREQLGPLRAVMVTEGKWHVNGQQLIDGVPVRYARLIANVNEGNLVLIGTESWGTVRIETSASLSSDDAERIAFDYVGGQSPTDRVSHGPVLEIVPESTSGYATYDPRNEVGGGYSHRLVWVLRFERVADAELWEALIDAHSGEIVAFYDTVVSATARVEGGTYPRTNTEVCPSLDKCGSLQPGTPMPWADYDPMDPTKFTNGAGAFTYSGGNTETRLQGKYASISATAFTCGEDLSETAAFGAIDLLGKNGHHDCTSSGVSASDTAAARTIFYEVSKTAEIGRSWLFLNSWLSSTISARANSTDFCNAAYSTGNVRFGRKDGSCRNAGEIAAVVDHEWGHGLDDHDSGSDPNSFGDFSNPREAYADIAASYRQQLSCIGYGLTQNDRGFGCGQTSDLTGWNSNQAQIGQHCNLDCSGFRETDWDKHANHSPDTVTNFVCGSCQADPNSMLTGPCGRQNHCESAPVTQAAWDLAKRDLQSAPFYLDENTAFIIASRLFYLGSGNVGSWHECTCPSFSEGCGAGSGYLQWLLADDDNGDPTDGTQHMTAIYNAFNRHAIACATPTPQNGGCNGGPATAPALTVVPSSDRFLLSWSSLPAAAHYWLFKSEGPLGCSQGKKRNIVFGTSLTDTEVVTNRQYCYTVMGIDDVEAHCPGPASPCICGTLSCSPPSTSPTLVNPPNGSTQVPVNVSFDWSDVTGANSYDVEVATDSGFSNLVTSTSLRASQWTVIPALNTGTHYWRVRSATSCGTSGWAQRSFTVCSAATASFDSSYQAPRCGSTSCACGSGDLLNSRDSIQGLPEVNEPNTIADSCADGTTGTYLGSYHNEGGWGKHASVERMTIGSQDGSLLDPLELVNVQVSVWCPTGHTNQFPPKLDLFYTSNASSPVWTSLITGVTCREGLTSLMHSFTLSNVNGNHAIRAQFGPSHPADACSISEAIDHDDLVFKVGL